MSCFVLLGKFSSASTALLLEYGAYRLLVIRAFISQLQVSHTLQGALQGLDWVMYSRKSVELDRAAGAGTYSWQGRCRSSTRSVSHSFEQAKLQASRLPTVYKSCCSNCQL